MYENEDIDFSVDVLKLGHHGSSTSSSPEFLDRVLDKNTLAAGNTFAVVSCGIDNKYRHPHTTTLERIGKLGIDDKHILRTDANGTVLMTLSDQGIETGGVVIEPSRTAKVNDSPVSWWHIVVGIEGLAFVILFLIVRTKKVKRKNKDRGGNDGEGKPKAKRGKKAA